MITKTYYLFALGTQNEKHVIMFFEDKKSSKLHLMDTASTVRDVFFYGV